MNILRKQKFETLPLKMGNAIIFQFLTDNFHVTLSFENVKHIILRHRFLYLAFESLLHFPFLRQNSILCFTIMFITQDYLLTFNAFLSKSFCSAF